MRDEFWIACESGGVISNSNLSIGAGEPVMTQSALQILAATDFSSRSDRALRRAGQLAKQLGGTLTITHIVDDDQPAHLIELETREAEKLLAEQLRTWSELSEIECKIHVDVGDAFDGILRVAEKFSAYLIVMGSHRKRLLRDIFGGTTIERVIRTGSRPVLMVNRDATKAYQRVLAAIDLSDASVHALTTAKDLGLLEQCQVNVVHAFTAVAKSTLYVADAKQSDIDKYVLAEARKVEADLQAFLDGTGYARLNATYLLKEGDPYDAIATAAKETDADMVLIGTHGRTGLTKIFLGSVAEQILCRLDIDILAVPPLR
jgi:universal stress protein E